MASTAHTKSKHPGVAASDEEVASNSEAGMPPRLTIPLVPEISSYIDPANEHNGEHGDTADLSPAMLETPTSPHGRRRRGPFRHPAAPVERAEWPQSPGSDASVMVELNTVPDLNPFIAHETRGQRGYYMIRLSVFLYVAGLLML